MKKKSRPMVKKIEDLINEMLDKIDNLKPEELLARQNVAKTAIDFLNLKAKLNLDEESASMFKEEEET
jgi:hypothetical protein